MTRFTIIVILLILVLLALIFITGQAQAATLDLTWDAPTTRTDGSSLSLNEITAYTLYYDNVTPPMLNKLKVSISTTWPSQSSMSYTLTGLQSNILHYVSVTATDQYGQESAMSNIASRVTPLPPSPSAPANFAAPIAEVR